jgi:U3 small nucleolar RNA-associated protein 12
LQLQEDALAVKLSPDGRLIAVSLMDSTIKVFFVDSLKFFLSLYGHKLPALTLDISSDSTLIVTGSADKNVKIWGLDFGDCHKSIFAHDDSVTGVGFVPNTHYFFTVGKDGLLKQWDADNYERIITLKGHINEVWTLSISPNGKYVVTSGHDKTLRLWEKTQEPLVLDDDREIEREKEEEEQLATGDRPHANDQDREAGLPSKKTALSEKSAEKLMEAIQTYKLQNRMCRIPKRIWLHSSFAPDYDDVSGCDNGRRIYDFVSNKNQIK